MSRCPRQTWLATGGSAVTRRDAPAGHPPLGVGLEPGSEASVPSWWALRHDQRVADFALELCGPQVPSATRRGAQSRRSSTPCASPSRWHERVQRNVIGERLLGLPRDPEPSHLERDRAAQLSTSCPGDPDTKEQRMSQQRLSFDDVHVATSTREGAQSSRAPTSSATGRVRRLQPMHHDEVLATCGPASVFGHGMFSMGFLGSRSPTTGRGTSPTTRCASPDRRANEVSPPRSPSPQAE